MLFISSLIRKVAFIAMKTISKTLIIILLLINCLIFTIEAKEGIEQNKLTAFKIAKSFDDLFMHKDIFIDLAQYDFIVGRISKLEVLKTGNILFLDDITKQVWLIKNNSNITTEINPEDAIPGIRWHPQFISFAPNGHICVISAPLSNVIYVFSPDGVFIRKITYEKGLKSIRDMDFSVNGDLIICYTEHNREYGIYKIKFDQSQKETSIAMCIKLNPQDYPNHISKTANSILFETDEQGNIFQAYITGPEIYKYTSDFQFIKKYVRIPKDFNKLERDLYSRNEFSKQVLNMMSNATILENIFHFNCCNIIMLQYSDISIKGTMLDFLTTDGKYLTKGNIIAPRRIMAVQGNSVYVVEPITELDENGHLSNPKIIKYELKLKNDTH